jgi:hypothetical protein
VGVNTHGWWIAGTGMLARKVVQAIVAAGGQVDGFVDEDVDAMPVLPGVKVLLPSDLPQPLFGARAFVAIGHASTRQRLMDMLQAAGWALPSVVHPRAMVATDARLADGVFVAAGAVVESACDVGRGAIIDIGVLIDHECRIGAFAHLRALGALGPRTVWPAV